MTRTGDRQGSAGQGPASPQRAARFGTATEIAAVVLVLAYNVAINRLIPASLYTPVNLTFAVAIVVWARGLDVSTADLGLRLNRLGRGLLFGLPAAAIIAAGILVFAAVPAFRHWFADTRAADTGNLAFQTLIRVPFGTAVPEELIFRSALLGLFLQRHTRRFAVAVTSVLFGMWHILPTIDRLSAGASGWPPHGNACAGLADVLGTVAFTAAAGVVFAWLRLRSQSVLAPILAHASFDSVGIVAARFVTNHPA